MHAQEGTYEIVIKKKEKKEENRWSLAEWYETKNKMRLQDMWLALHTSDNPFEFILGYSKVSGDGNLEVQDINFTAYASIVGLSYSHIQGQNNATGYNAEFLLRLLGTSTQNTNLTLGYGIMNRSNFENPYATASLTFYLFKHFGLYAKYNHIPSETNSAGEDVSGTSTQYQAFIDYGILRIFFGTFSENLEFKAAGTTKLDTTGSQIGVNFYF